jgi:hypothetical protein
VTTGALTGIDVAVEIGFGSPPGAASPSWTDVSAYVAWDVAPIRIEPGRTAERDGLAARRLTLTLDNDPVAPALTSRRFDPRNASGPYYGDLVPRVPIRVRVTYSATTWTLFRGFIDGGWPQDWSNQFMRYVPIEAVDAIAYMAQTPPPASAFESTVDAYFAAESISPDVWLRSASEGHLDKLTGKPVNATTAMVPVDGVILGEGQAFGTESRDGYSLTQDASLFPVQEADSSGTELLWTCWFRADLDDADTASVDLVIVPTDDPATSAAFRVRATPTGVAVTVGNQYGEEDGFFQATVVGDDGTVTPLDGKPHLAAVWASLPTSGGGGAAASVRVWLDAVELFKTTGSDSNSDASPSNRMGIGGHPFNIDAGSRYDGVIDHVISWWDSGAWSVTADEVVAAIYAARTARAGDRLDERFTWLADAVGWDHVGTVDVSGIVTQKRHDGAGSTLDILTVLEESEQGRIWVDNEGRLRFSQRGWAWDDATANTVQETFSDDATDLAGSALPYLADLSRIVDDDRKLVNVAKVTRSDGREQTVEDAASIAAHGRRNPVDLNNLLYATDRQSRSVAEWIVYAAAEPTPRVEKLAVSVMNKAANLAPFAAQVEPGWLLRVKRDGVTVDAHVVAAGHEISIDRWIIDLLIDGTRAGYSWFRWDDGTGTVGSQWDGTDGWAF